MRLAALLAFLIPVIGGCASSRHCERSEQVYGGAVEQAPLQAPEGLEVPSPDPNYAIPEATGEDVPYSVTVTNARGRRGSRCLDAPPPMPAVALPPEPGPGLDTEPLSEQPGDDPELDEF